MDEAKAIFVFWTLRKRRKLVADLLTKQCLQISEPFLSFLRVSEIKGSGSQGRFKFFQFQPFLTKFASK